MEIYTFSNSVCNISELPQVHQLLEILKKDVDTDSAYSEDGTDSGSGGGKQQEEHHIQGEATCRYSTCASNQIEGLYSVLSTDTPAKLGYLFYK